MSFWLACTFSAALHCGASPPSYDAGVRLARLDAPHALTSPAHRPAPGFAERWPRSGRIVYRVMRGADGLVVGRSEQRWEHDGKRYRLQATTETAGLAALLRQVRLVQESSGILDAAGLRPLEFVTRRTGKNAQSIRFDPQQGKIVLADGSTLPFVAGAQDTLSLFHHVAVLPADASRFSLAVATVTRVAVHEVAASAELALETPLGARAVRHFKIHGRTGEDVTEIWLDTTTRLPLKIRHRDRAGEVLEQVALSIETGAGP
ncbi:MAG: DUF3108 domain-containing protein [Sulfuritalea sp.]|nr:DUF3108 domain-containing protein [Sulfuritalea sp.]